MPLPTTTKHKTNGSATERAPTKCICDLAVKCLETHLYAKIGYVCSFQFILSFRNSSFLIKNYQNCCTCKMEGGRKEGVSFQIFPETGLFQAIPLLKFGSRYTSILSLTNIVGWYCSPISYPVLSV